MNFKTTVYALGWIQINYIINKTDSNEEEPLGLSNNTLRPKS